MFLISSFQHLHKYLHFLLTMILNHVWVLILFNSRKIQLKNEFIDSEKKISSSRWKTSENSLKITWKKISVSKRCMLMFAERKFSIIKLMIKFDYSSRIFKSIDSRENWIIKCSNRSKFYKKKRVSINSIYLMK